MKTLLDDIDQVAFFPFLFSQGEVQIQDFHRRFFELVLGSVPKIEILREPTLFDEVIVPEQLWWVNHSVNPACRSVYRDVFDLYRGSQPKRRIFLSRSEKVGQRVSNAAEVEEVFKSNGFSIMYPENLSIDAQLGAYANCEIMAGFSGSALHNCLFCAPNTPLLEIGDERASDRFLIMQAMANTLSGVAARRIPFVGKPGTAFDVGTLDRALKDELDALGVAKGVSKMSSTPPKQFSRAEVIQGLLSLSEQSRYLEIGVNEGDTFRAVEADTKVAVDPNFLFDHASAAAKAPNETYHSVTSDIYFGSVIDKKARFDVIFLDGLHTATQTLRDFINSVNFVSENGVIIIDDVIPNSYHASLPDHTHSYRVRTALNVADKSWMGDVYKVVFFINSFLQQFSFATVAESHGMLVVWKQARMTAAQDENLLENIGRLPFESTLLQRDKFNVMPFDQILSAVQSSSSLK